MDREPLLLEAFGPCLPSSSERGKHFKRMILDSGATMWEQIDPCIQVQCPPRRGCEEHKALYLKYKYLEKTHFENVTKVLTCSFHTSTNSLAHKPDFLSVCPPIKQQNRLCAEYKNLQKKLIKIGLPLQKKQKNYDTKCSMKNQIPNYKPNKVLPPPTLQVAQTEFA